MHVANQGSVVIFQVQNCVENLQSLPQQMEETINVAGIDWGWMDFEKQLWCNKSQQQQTALFSLESDCSECTWFYQMLKLIL